MAKPKAPRKSHAARNASRKSSSSGSEYDKMTVAQLKQLLEERGVDWKLLPKSGKSTHIKKDFIDALKEDDAGAGAIPKKKVESILKKSPPKEKPGFKPGRGIADIHPSPVKPGFKPGRGIADIHPSPVKPPKKEKPAKPKKNTSKEGSPPKVKKCLLPDQEVYIICFWDKEAYDHNPDMGGQDASYVLPNFDLDNRISAAREFLKDTNPKLANAASEELGDMMGGMRGVTYNNDLYYIDMFKGKVLKNM